MHPCINEVLSYLDVERRALEEAVSAVPPALRERRPTADRWSVSEILEHLALVETRITALLAGRIDAARAAGLGPAREIDPVLPTLDLETILDRSRPLVASEAAQPTGSQDSDAALAELARARGVLREIVLSADGLALEEVIVPHPRFGPLNVYQWLLFVGGHEARHTAQIREAA